MKDSYREMIKFGSHQHNVPQHDAFMIIPGSTAAAGGYTAQAASDVHNFHHDHYEVNVFPFAQGQRRGANGRVIVAGVYPGLASDSPKNNLAGHTGATGEMFRIDGLTSDGPKIYPFQAKGFSGINHCTVYGLM